MTNFRKILNFLIFIAFFLPSFGENLNNCFFKNDNYECHLSVMTPYRLIINKNDSELRYPDCAPKKIWLFVRHGTRYPGKKWTKRMSKKLPEFLDAILKNNESGKGKMKKEEIEKLKNWKFKFSEIDAMKLAPEGEIELIGLAERFQSRFPSVMPEIYDNVTYKFKYTATQRTERSAKSFALGLFGRKQSFRVCYPAPKYRDPVLRFYKSCKRWRREIDESPEAYEEYEKFIAGPVAKKLIAEVSNRVGFELDYESVKIIYMICAFETAWYENYKSPWCNLFSLENFEVLEFAQDLHYYWIDGYGYSLTYKQACNAMKDVFNFFESEDNVTTTAYFTHSGALLKTLAFLGIANEKEILKSNSFPAKKNRIWRTSLIDSFASNIAFVFYDCKKNGPGIILMHQERVVQLDDCPQGIPCPLSIMKKKFLNHETECQFEKMCAI